MEHIKNITTAGLFINQKITYNSGGHAPMPPSGYALMATIRHVIYFIPKVTQQSVWKAAGNHVSRFF